MSQLKSSPQSRSAIETRLVKGRTNNNGNSKSIDSSFTLSTVFKAASARDLKDRFAVRDDRIYTRFGHPTLTAVADRLADMENAEAALLFPSGMSAITTSILTVVKTGNHVIFQDGTFAQTQTFAAEMLTRLGVQVDFVDGYDTSSFKNALKDNTALICIDTPSNPTLTVVDIQGVAEIARSRNVPLFVDSTFASPFLQQPLELGASLAMHSGTKFLGGHSDVLCGAIAGDKELIASIKETQILLGGILDPSAAWRLGRGMKTLGVRMKQQCQNALEIAKFLESQKQIVRVLYPFLESHPRYELARKQMHGGGGGVLSFELNSAETARTFLDNLSLIPTATSLGGIETVIEIPYDLDFGHDQLGEGANTSNVAVGLIRLSVGIESIDDLIDDLKRGFSAIA